MHCVPTDRFTKFLLEKVEKKTKNFRHSTTLRITHHGIYIIHESRLYFFSFPDTRSVVGSIHGSRETPSSPSGKGFIILKNNCPFSSSLNRINLSSFLATENAKYSYSLRYKETALQMRFPTTYYKHVIGCFKNALVALFCPHLGFA